MQRSYEVMFIVRPDMEEADVDKLIAGLEQTITHGGGSVKSTEKRDAASFPIWCASFPTATTSCW